MRACSPPALEVVAHRTRGRLPDRNSTLPILDPLRVGKREARKGGGGGDLCGHLSRLIPHIERERARSMLACCVTHVYTGCPFQKTQAKRRARSLNYRRTGKLRMCVLSVNRSQKQNTSLPDAPTGTTACESFEWAGDHNISKPWMVWSAFSFIKPSPRAAGCAREKQFDGMGSRINRVLPLNGRTGPVTWRMVHRCYLCLPPV